MQRYIKIVALAIGMAGTAFAQPEAMAWGNLTGIRVDGYLMPLNSALCVAEADWSNVVRTGRERQTNVYKREGKVETVQLSGIRSRAGWTLASNQVIEDTGTGMAKVDVTVTSAAEANIAGAYYCLQLPASVYSGGSAELIEPAAGVQGRVSLAPMLRDQNEYVRGTAKGIRLVSARRQIEVMFDQATEVIIRDDRRDNNYDLHVYMAVAPGKMAAGQSSTRCFHIKATGEVDQDPVEVAVDASRPGQMFDGMGGNFRLQNAKTDPQVIDYNLKNMRVSWGRVEMPWRNWHAEEGVDPLAEARSGKVDPRVDAAMVMAQRLGRMGMPVIVSAWFPPNWAALGAPARGGGGGGLRGRVLNPEKMDQIYESLAGYMLFLKEKYGVEAVAFSFNESDLGIDVRQTAREHAELIKGLGRRMAEKGLATKLLLGDTSDANPVDFIKPGLADPEVVKYVSAVSFHSWRGCTDEILKFWGDAARQLNVPLLVGEGSTDAAAYRYPQIFLEQSFAMYEVNLYTRILAIAQPKSILQWQLTADYSLLAGGGIWNDNTPLRPTQRFWNLKQLGETPAQAFHLPVKCEKADLTCAAFGNIARGEYAVHVVNNGGARPATLTGLPASVSKLKVLVTDRERGMVEMGVVPVVEGKAAVRLEGVSFMTFMSVE